MLIHDDDTSDPNPPDIRPYGRINTPPNVRATRAVNPPATAPRRAAGTISTAFGVEVRPRIQAVLAVLVFAFLPLAAGHPTAATDASAHTYPRPGLGADAPLAFGGTEAEAEWYRDPTRSAHPTPVLSFLKWGAEGVFAALHSAADVFGSASPQQSPHMHTLAKRHLNGEHIAMACMIPVLVALSGMFAGLTLGYFSVDPTQLHVLSISGTPKQQEYARRILPVRKDSHLLLTTLILGNMIVNEALPVIADGVLGGGILAVVISTALVVIFAEIIPQSVCSRHGLAIGATMAPVVRVLTWIFFPLAWPIAKLLEYILGAHHGIIYRRSELRELIKMHAAGGGGGGDLDVDTVTIAQGALDLSQKTAMDAMTPMDNVFMLPITAKLDYETLGLVVQSGHSRIPVYQMVEVPDINLQAPAGTGPGPKKTKIVKKVLGSMLVKSCVLLDPEDATPLASMPINSIPSVPFDEPLTKMLNAFQEGRSHMAIVSRRGKVDDLEDAASVMTAAAGSLRQRIMRKVGISKSSSSGSDTDSDDTDMELGKKHKRFWHKSTTAKSVSAGSTESLESPVEPNPTKDTRKQNEKKPPSRGFSLESAKLTQNEQAVPSDAQLPRANFEQFFEGLEGAPLGIITLEDVLEELIGEEIYDEYDEHDGQRPRVAALARVIPRKTGSALNPATAASPPEHAATPATTDIPSPVDSHHDTSAVPKRVKLPAMTRFSLGRRPASQPGRPRVPIESLSAPVPTAPSPTPAEKEIDTVDDRQTRADTLDAVSPPTRSPSAPAPAVRPRPALADGSLSPRPRATPLDTATMDRSLRRLAAEGSLRRLAAEGSAAATGHAPPLVRGASQGSIPRTQTPLQAGQAGRRTPKFKSAPINKDVRDGESNVAHVGVAGGVTAAGDEKHDTKLNEGENEKA